MYPDQNQYSIDYLNQIAPPEKKPGIGNKIWVLLLIVGVLLLTIIGFLTLLGSGNTPKKDVSTLAVRLENLQAITAGAQKNIKSSQLRSLNSSLSIYLTNTNRDIVEPLAKNQIDLAKIDKSIREKEDSSVVTAKLEDARLNAVYDSSYLREIKYQLATTAALMKKVYEETNSESLKKFLVSADKDLQVLITQFNEFTPLGN